jgi:hypothetical protein
VEILADQTDETSSPADNPREESAMDRKQERSEAAEEMRPGRPRPGTQSDEDTEIADSAPLDADDDAGTDDDEDLPETEEEAERER